MKNGAIRGFGSRLPYTGRAYISVTMFSGRENQLFRSRTGTSGYSSALGSSASQAQSSRSSTSPTAAIRSAGTQPSKKRMVPSVRRFPFPSSSAVSDRSRSA